jgi:transposase
MKSITEFGELFIHRQPVDMRKNINGLSIIVQEGMGCDLKSNSLFIFCNQRRTHLKILYFDKSGFALWLKRLEGSKFSWPKTLDQNVISISVADMKLLLDGINIWTRFEEVHFDHLV